MVSLKTDIREVLVEIGMNRRKTFLLDSSNSLLIQLKEYMHSDSALSELLSDSYIVLQEFNTKFGTWVDIDGEENLWDGAVLKVIYCPKVPRLNHGSLKKKSENCVSDQVPKKYHVCDDIENKSYLQHIPIQSNKCEKKEDHSEVCSLSNVKLENPSTLTISYNMCKVPSQEKYKFTSPHNSFDRSCSVVSKCLCNEMPSPPSASSKNKRFKLEENNINPHVQPNELIENIQERKPAYSFTASSPPSLKDEQKIETVGSTSLEQQMHAGKSAEKNNQNVTGEVVVKREERACTCSDSASGNKTSVRQIVWVKPVQCKKRDAIKKWAYQNAKRNWRNNFFLGGASFAVQNNRIKYFDEIDLDMKDGEVLWGICSYGGPNVVGDLGWSGYGQRVLKNTTYNWIYSHAKKGAVTLNISEALKFRSTFKQKFNLSVWPAHIEDISPLHHVWKLVAEKCENIPCSSRMEMIAIVSRVFETDLDVRSLGSILISFLPQIFDSVMDLTDQEKIIIEYGVTV